MRAIRIWICFIIHRLGIAQLLHLKKSGTFSAKKERLELRQNPSNSQIWGIFKTDKAVASTKTVRQ